MENSKDATVNLLKECDAGTKMAVSSIDEVISKVKDSELKDLLNESRTNHEKLGNDLHALLIEYESREKEPNVMAKGMSWVKTNVKMTMDESDATIADLITDGCNMGIKSLNKYLNEYSAADSCAKDICNRLIKIENTLRQSLTKYL